MPYACLKETSKITHSIIHKHKYTYIVKHRVLYLWVCRAHTHPKQSTLRVTRVSTCAHRSGIFQQVRKSYKVNPADYISNMTKTCWVCSKPKSSGNVLTYQRRQKKVFACFLLSQARLGLNSLGSSFTYNERLFQNCPSLNVFSLYNVYYSLTPLPLVRSIVL